MNVKANRRGLGRVIAPLALLVMAVAVLFMGGMGFTKAQAESTPIEREGTISFSNNVVTYESVGSLKNCQVIFYYYEGYNMEFMDIVEKGSSQIVLPMATSEAASFTFPFDPGEKLYSFFCLLQRAGSAVLYNSNVLVLAPPFIKDITLTGNILKYTPHPLADLSVAPHYIYSVKNGAGLTASEIVEKVDNHEGWIGSIVLDNRGSVQLSDDLIATLFPTNGKYWGALYSVGLDGSLSRYSTVFMYEKGVIPLPEDPVKEGYTFVGWYLDEALTQPYDGRPITSDVSLYAKFEINRYDVTLDVNGGRLTDSTGAEVSKVTGDHGFNVVTVLDGYTLEREGYDFLGWYIGDQKIDGTYQVKGAITLKAKWQVKTYTVTFIVDGEVYKTLEVNHGTTFQQAMQEDKELAYMFLLDENGAVIGKGTAITGAVTVPVGEMTTEEKIATFIGNNWWLLWLLGALAVAGIGAAVIASIVAQKRK